MTESALPDLSTRYRRKANGLKVQVTLRYRLFIPIIICIWIKRWKLSSRAKQENRVNL